MAQSERTGLVQITFAFTVAPVPAVVFAVVFAVALGGCSLDPGAPLIPTPERQATVLPADVPAVRADGFPNVLADPVSVRGRPRDPEAVAAEAEALAVRGARTSAETAAVPRGGHAAQLSARGRTHVDETRRAIEAGARPQTSAPPRLSDRPPTALPVPASPSTDDEAAADGNAVARAAPRQ